MEPDFDLDASLAHAKRVVDARRKATRNAEDREALAQLYGLLTVSTLADAQDAYLRFDTQPRELLTLLEAKLGGPPEGALPIDELLSSSEEERPLAPAEAHARAVLDAAVDASVVTAADAAADGASPDYAQYYRLHELRNQLYCCGDPASDPEALAELRAWCREAVPDVDLEAIEAAERALGGPPEGVEPVRVFLGNE